MRGLAVFLALIASAMAANFGTGVHVWETVHKDMAVEVHNKWRCGHTKNSADTPIMSWSDLLGKKAQCWAEKMAAGNYLDHSTSKDCCFADGGDCKYGENILYTGGFSSASSEQLADLIKNNFQMWYDEVQKYNPGNPGFAGGTGHFTQVVWKGSLSLGCGSAASSSGRIYMSCNYFTAGNFNTAAKFQENVLCQNSAGTPCIPFRSPDTCNVDQFYNAGPVQWSPITPGTTSSNAKVISKGTTVHVVSPHAVKVVHTLRHDGGVPDEPDCSKSPSHAGNFDDFYFKKDDDGKDLNPGELVVLKVKGCASAGHSDGPTSTGYFKIDQLRAPDKAVYTPGGGSKIPKNAHVIAKCAGAEKVCYTIDDSTPSCDQSKQCEDHDYVDVVVDHDENLKVIGCVRDGSTWLKSAVTTETYTIETADHRCDDTFRGSWSNMMDWECSSGCGAYLMAKYNTQYNYCSSCKGTFASSVADAEAKNPGWFVFDHDGQRCSEFGKTAKCSKGGAASDKSDAAEGTSGAWTTTTTVVLVVGLVGIVAFFVVGVVVGKRMIARGQASRAEDAAKFENLADEQEL